MGYSFKHSTTQKVAQFQNMGENLDAPSQRQDDCFGVHSGGWACSYVCKVLTIINSLINQFRDSLLYTTFNASSSSKSEDNKNIVQRFFTRKILGNETVLFFSQQLYFQNSKQLPCQQHSCCQTQWGKDGEGHRSNCHEHKRAHSEDGVTKAHN